MCSVSGNLLGVTNSPGETNFSAGKHLPLFVSPIDFPGTVGGKCIPAFDILQFLAESTSNRFEQIYVLKGNCQSVVLGPTLASFGKSLEIQNLRTSQDPSRPMESEYT